jgi:hypothetical protein
MFNCLVGYQLCLGGYAIKVDRFELIQLERVPEFFQLLGEKFLSPYTFVTVSGCSLRRLTDLSSLREQLSSTISITF